METIEIRIEGMSCEHCAARVQKALAALKGVREATVELEAGSAVITGDGIDADAVVAAVDEAGYSAMVV
jgi:Cu+-exporting ATPase